MLDAKRDALKINALPAKTFRKESGSCRSAASIWRTRKIVLDPDLASDLSLFKEIRVRKYYQIHDFAELAGVTVKALHHYDRLGLLQPGRNEAGYRMYTERDLERLEQIVALKFLGLPLKQIKVVLDRAELELPDALRMQRQAIEDKQELLGRALQAIRAAEAALQPGKPADPSILKKIIEVIDMQDGVKEMKKYYSDAAWELRKQFYEQGPSAEWQEFYRDVVAMLGEDPASDNAQQLAERWLALSLRANAGDPTMQTHSGTAWMHREDWPQAMKREMARFRLEEVHEFLHQIGIASRKKYFAAEAWEKLEQVREREEQELSMSWQRLRDLYRDIDTAVGEDPAGELAQSLAGRWRLHIDKASGGDPTVKEGLLKARADRRNWPSTLKWQAEAIYGLSFDRFLTATDFMDRALAAF
jgi:DNA-binding transcriptional MerR regulator